MAVDQFLNWPILIRSIKYASFLKAVRCFFEERYTQSVIDKRFLVLKTCKVRTWQRRFNLEQCNVTFQPIIFFLFFLTSQV
jgi:hypothetical protein